MRLKNNIPTLLLAGLLTVGCESLDQQPFESLSTESAIQTPKDVQYWANGFYSSMRSSSYGKFLVASEVQSDILNATVDFGNNYGQSQIWDIQTGNYDVRDYWLYRYSALKNINVSIAKFQSVPTQTAEEAKQVKQSLGEAHAIRAYYFFQLAQHFAKNYNPASASSDLGIPLVTKYDVKEMPARATMSATFEQILADISTAESLLATKTNSKGSQSFTLDAVKALKARVLLEKQDWTNAYASAVEVINSGRYPLVSTAKALKGIWHADATDETIMQLYVAKPDELPNTQGVFLGLNAKTKKYTPSFIPSKWVVDLYDDADIRKGIYFEEKPVYLGATDYKVVLINKYPGNPELYSGNTNYAHAPKIFRIAEQYLIAAEAAYRNNDETNALKYLNTLRKARGLSDVSAAGEVLFKEIKDERLRELAFEGFRLNDLKRWGMGVKRHSPQSVDYIMTTPSTNFYELDKPASHFMFVWPIPSRDSQLNKNIVQNQGY